MDNVNIRWERCRGWECVTYYDKLAEISDKYPDKLAAADEDEELTFKELKHEADKLSVYLYQRGLRKGDHVIVQLPNCVMFVKVMFAMFRIGLLPVLALPSHRLSVIDGIARKCSPKAYITTENFYNFSYRDLAKQAAESVNGDMMIFTEKELTDLSDETEFPCVEKPDYRDIAVILLSGGTTGIPKLIARTHGDYIYNAKVTAERCGWNKETVYLVALPASHNFALNAPGIFGALILGGSIVLSPYSSPLDLYDIIVQHKVTSLSLVPQLLKMFTQYRKIDSASDLSSLETVLVGGAMLYPKDAEEFIDTFGNKLIQVFGTAEGLICTTSPDDERETVVYTQGKPCSEYDEIGFIGAEDVRDENAVSGELITKGPYTITSYYLCPEAQSTSFTPDGWYRTGDLAELEDNGNIRIMGRVKEMINRSGEKIIPSELEEILTASELCGTFAIIGLPDELCGNRICCCYNSEVSYTTEQLNAELRKKNIADFQMIERAEKIDEWPLTAVGKTDKKKLLEIVNERRKNRNE